MRKQDFEKYKKHLGNYIYFGTSGGIIQGKLIDISDNCFLFNPYIRSKLTKEDDRIFNKSSLESKTLELTINDPKTDIVVAERTEEELIEYCETSSIVEKAKSIQYKESNEIGLKRKD